MRIPSRPGRLVLATAALLLLAPTLPAGAHQPGADDARTDAVGRPVAVPAPSPGRITQIASDDAGNTYFHDIDANQVFRQRPDGSATLVAGNGETGPLVEGRATASPLGWVEDLAVSADGTLYLADHTNFAVAEVTPGGTLSILEGATEGTPSGVGVDRAGNVYVADCGTEAVRRIDTAGTVTTLLDRNSAVPGWRGSFHPETIEVDPAGNVWIEDTGNYVIDRITPDGDVSVVAGTGEEWDRPVPGPALETTVYVASMAVADDGTLYVAGHADGVGRISPATGMFSVLDARIGNPDAGTARRPWTIGLAPDGDLVAYYGDDHGLRPALRRFEWSDLEELDPDQPQRTFPTLQYSYTSSVRPRGRFRADVAVLGEEAAVPTGTVHLVVAGRPQPPRPLVAGRSQVSAALPWRRGRHRVTVVYSGDERYRPVRVPLEVRLVKR